MSSISSHSELYIPSIVVTPALPSRNSLSSDMRATLDSIVGPAATHPSSASYAEDSDEARWAYAIPNQGLDEFEHSEAPNAPFHAQAATAENPFRLELDLKHARFSVNALLSAFEATCRNVTGRGDVKSIPEADDAGDTSSSREHLHADPETSSETYVVVEEDMAGPPVPPKEEKPKGAADEEGVLDARVVRRAPLPVRKANPTWRHAIYISTLVWPAEDDNRGQVSGPSGADTLGAFEVTRSSKSRLGYTAPSCTEYYVSFLSMWISSHNPHESKLFKPNLCICSGPELSDYRSMCYLGHAEALPALSVGLKYRDASSGSLQWTTTFAEVAGNPGCFLLTLCVGGNSRCMSPDVGAL
ncbi:hypothetical protein C2E23DRAFT_892874 [Lenzites betulinus]|nr:hypothetical protein C2E23DRAFT_892874 [Lenzites betulinus]